MNNEGSNQSESESCKGGSFDDIKAEDIAESENEIFENMSFQTDGCSSVSTNKEELENLFEEQLLEGSK